MRIEKVSLVMAFIWLAGFLGVEAQNEIPSAFGTHLYPIAEDWIGAKTFQTGQRIVGTYYFYWYDTATKTHVINPGEGTDALTDHPPTLDGFSWKSVAWHRRQLIDMETAGIDIALMVFWGAPSEHQPGSQFYWSFEGLKPLVEARAQLLREGRHPPAIGLFYDTSTLANNSWHTQVDLTTDYGRQWFYATVRDFFSCIPPRDWAMIDNKPVMLMYAAAFAKNYDQSFIGYTKKAFAEDFGGRTLFIAPQNSWQVTADSQCAWGGALGLKRADICALGPGYDQSAVPGRKPLIALREGGKFYENNWLKFLRRPSNFVMLETWNEFHEGTDICESKEYGRTYIDLTQKYTRLFKSGWKSEVSGNYKNALQTDIILGEKNRENGLRLVNWEDGASGPVTVKGFTAVKLAPPASRYLYFAVDDSFKWADSMRVKVKVEYFDAGTGNLFVEFDGADSRKPFKGVYTPSGGAVEMTGGNKWKTAEFELRNARFWNSQNGEADFRLDILNPDICIHRVTLVRE